MLLLRMLDVALDAAAETVVDIVNIVADDCLPAYMSKVAYSCRIRTGYILLATLYVQC